MATKNNPGKFDCYANAEPDEPMFVLLGRDRMGASIVRLWALAREGEGLTANEKLEEAYQCACAMADHAESLGKTALNALDYLPFDVLQRALERRGATVTPAPHGGDAAAI